jgi:hypothetical protein
LGWKGKEDGHGIEGEAGWRGIGCFEVPYILLSFAPLDIYVFQSLQQYIFSPYFLCLKKWNKMNQVPK